MHSSEDEEDKLGEVGIEEKGPGEVVQHIERN